MGWVALEHDCELPDGRMLNTVGARVGSKYECDQEGCGRIWELTERQTRSGAAFWQLDNITTHRGRGDLSTSSPGTRDPGPADFDG